MRAAAASLVVALSVAAAAGAQGRDDVATVARSALRSRHDIPVALAVFLPGAANPAATTVDLRISNRSNRFIVACGVLVLRRDAAARPRPDRHHVIRPWRALEPGRAETVSLPLGGAPPEVELDTTFALFADGSWIGDASRARAEIDGRRDAYRAARAIAVDLRALPPRPRREALVRLAARFSLGLSRAVTPDGRAQYEAALRTLAASLDERLRRGRPYGESLAAIQRRVDRVLDDSAHLPFVVGPVIRE